MNPCFRKQEPHKIHDNDKGYSFEHLNRSKVFTDDEADNEHVYRQLNGASRRLGQEKPRVSTNDGANGKTKVGYTLIGYYISKNLRCDGKLVYKGPNGGHHYVNENGNKTYLSADIVQTRVRKL